MTKLFALAAAAALTGGVASPISYFGATRNLFIGATPMFEMPDGVLAQLETALKERDQETLKKLAALDTKLDETATRTTKRIDEEMRTLEQKLLDRTPAGGPVTKSLGSQFTESAQFKALAEMPDGERKHARASFSTKATITSATADAAGSAGAGVVPVTRPIDQLARRRLTVRDLLPVIQISSGSVEVPVEKAFTNNAGMVAEGSAKPQSDLQLELQTFNARTIAHYMKASRQVLDDVPQLRGLIDTELTYGLKLKEELQLLSGDNTGQNLNGMIPQATAYAAPIVIADITILDVIALAALQAANANYAADAAVINISDWWAIRLLKDTNGNYIYGPPSDYVEPRIFGLPVVPTPAMTSRKFLVGEFQRAATIYDRWEARVEVATQNEDDFIKNLLTVLCEERLAFAVTRPTALVYGDFDNALSA